MKQKSTDLRHWQRVPKQKLFLKTLDQLTLVYLQALEVSEPLWVKCADRAIKIMDNGYQWLFICQFDKPYCVTAQFDDQGRPVQWYVDIVAKWHQSASGFPYFDDLYLDIVCTPAGSLDIQDADELAEARQTDIISERHYNFAWAEACGLCDQIRAKRFEPILQSQNYLELFKRDSDNQGTTHKA